MDLSFFKNLFSNSPKGSEAAEEEPVSAEQSAQGPATQSAEGEDEVQVKPARQSRRASHRGGRRREREPRSDEEMPAPQPEEVERLMAKLEQFVLFTAKSLVDSPDEVSTQVVQRENGYAIIVSCAKRDIGKIIGKSGKLIAAIRILVSGAASRIGVKATADIDE